MAVCSPSLLDPPRQIKIIRPVAVCPARAHERPKVAGAEGAAPAEAGAVLLEPLRAHEILCVRLRNDDNVAACAAISPAARSAA